MSAPKLGAPDHHLDNLCVILDYNGIQLDDFVKKILDLEPVTDKLKAFGWPVLEVNGHDIAQIDKALDQAEATKGGPTFIVAHTIKGKGVSFMENDPEWHGKAPEARGGGARDPGDRWASPLPDVGRARSSRSSPRWGRSDGRPRPRAPRSAKR